MLCPAGVRPRPVVWVRARLCVSLQLLCPKLLPYRPAESFPPLFPPLSVAAPIPSPHLEENLR